MTRGRDKRLGLLGTAIDAALVLPNVLTDPSPPHPWLAGSATPRLFDGEKRRPIGLRCSRSHSTRCGCPSFRPVAR